MNVWTLYRKTQHSFRQKIQTLIFKFIDVDKQQRNMFEQVVVMINYFLTYVIMFFLITQSLAQSFISNNTQHLYNDPVLFASQSRLPTVQISNYYFQVITILLLIRLSFACVYIFTQKVYFLIVNKALLIVNIFLTEFESANEDFIAIEAPLFFIETLMIAVWAYKIERRIKHLDSRLHSIYPFLKEFTVYMMAMLIRRVQKMIFTLILLSESPSYNTSTSITLFEIQALIVIILCLTIVVIADFSDFLYNTKFKRILLNLDGILVLVLFSWIVLHVLLKQKFLFYHFLALSFVMLFSMFFGLRKKNDYSILYFVEGRYLQYQSEDYLLEYFETVRKLMTSQGSNIENINLEMVKFIDFHRSSCLYPTCPLTQRFNIRDPVEVKAQLIEEFMIKTIQSLMPIKPILKKYLIHYLSPKDKVYRYLNQTIEEQDSKGNKKSKDEYLKRQLFRLSRQKKDRTNQIKILEAQAIRDQILAIIEDFLISGKSFYSILTKDRINTQNLLLYGKKMLESIEQIQKLKQINNANFTQGARLIINNFTSRLVQYPKTPLLQTVIDPPFLIQKTTQTCPTLLVSAEPQNYLSIIDANIACTKEFYVQKQVFLKLTVIDLLPQQIKAQHLAYFDKIVKKTQFDGKKLFPKALFVLNKLGFATFFLAEVYSFYSIKGRIWCVAIQIVHKMKSIILIAKQGNGRVMSISQMSVFHGFNINDKGKQFTKEFFQQLLTKKDVSGLNYKKVVVDPYEKIFENSEFHFMETKSMQIIEENTAFGFTYYLAEITSTQDNYGSKDSRSSLNRSIASDDIKTHISMSNQEVNFEPKHQFHYHSDGVVRQWKQNQENILSFFNEIRPFSQNSENQTLEELGKDIVEMRLINDQLDFLQNIEQQQQFMSKPMTKLQRKKNEINQFNLKQDFLKQCLQNETSTTPKWLFYTRIAFVLVFVAFLSGLIFIYVNNLMTISTIDTQLQIVSSISDNQLQLLKLSKLLLGYKFYAPAYFRKTPMSIFISNVTLSYEQNSKTLNDLDSSITTYFSTGTLQTVLSRYFIAFNNISTISGNLTALMSYDEQPVLFDITQNIVPAYNLIISQKMSQFFQKISSGLELNLILILLMDIITVGIWIWVFLVQRYVEKMEQKLFWLMSKIPDSLIDKQLIKLTLFEQYLHFDKDIYCEDDIEYIMETRKQISSQKYQQNTSGKQKKRKTTFKRKRSKISQEQLQQQIDADSHHRISSEKKIDSNDTSGEEQNPYIKKLIYSKKISFITVFSLLWTIAIVALNHLFIGSIAQYNQFSQEIGQLHQSLNQIQSTSDTIWLLFNRFPTNITAINLIKKDMYLAQDNFKQQLVSINRQGWFDSQFISTTQDLWLGNCCQYIPHTPSCSTQLKGALMQGADQITSYIKRKYQYLISQSLSQNDFHSSNITYTLSNLQLYYFDQIKSINQNMIFQQHGLIKDKYQRIFFAYFVVIILFFAAIGVIYKLISMKNDQLIKLEQFFKLIEFDSLKNVKEFKLYIKETYYDKIFR